jgi:putative ABC transport system substrate-binding protein
MIRRDVLTLLGGAAAAWPVGARAQQGVRIRRVGVLIGLAEDDPLGQVRIGAFRQTMQQLGWTDGGNVRIEVRWGAGDANRLRKYAEELVALAPDAILASGGVTMQALQHANTVVPVVFTSVLDPVGAGYVASLARPGSSATGFTLFEYGVSAKWLELLKEIAPQLRRAAVLRDAAATSGTAQFASIQAVASSTGVELSPVGGRNASEIEDAITAFARGSTGGLIVAAGALATVHRELLTALASRHKLPAIYFERLFVSAGGLMSYGPDQVDPHRRAAGYVDRILKGEKPADLPVQAPVKYELVINLRTAKALGLTVPQTLLVAADEVIE